MQKPVSPAGSLAAAVPVSRHWPLGVAAFVAIMAGLNALNALAIDIMLPGLPQITESLRAASVTESQTIITLYFLGFGVGQLLMGVLSDRFGRKPVLIGGLAVYTLAAAACAFAPDLGTMLVLRAIQGFGSSAPRVIAVAAIRDCYEGRQMARIMSLTMMVFMAAPVLAPSLGALILLVMPWPWLFGVLAIYGGMLLAVCAARLPETLAPEHRLPIRAGAILAGLGSVFGSRQTMGYTLAAGTFFGALFGFITSAQQVLADVMGLGPWFTLVFALPALMLALSSFLNSRLVERFGMRVLSHGAVLVQIAASAGMVTLALAGHLGAAAFIPLMMLVMLVTGLVFANFNALAMQPQGHVAGIASSVTGALSTLLGALIGFAIGQSFDGTALPLAAGFLGCGLLTLGLLLVTERGRLLRAGGA